MSGSIESGIPNRYKTGAGLYNKMSGIYIGKIKKNEDKENHGRVWVWIGSTGSSEDDERYWLPVVYTSPFAGATDQLKVSPGKTYKATQKSYGWWATPPDINNYVICAFPEGVPWGIWFSCLYQTSTNQTVPGIPYDTTTAGEFPAANKNRLSQGKKDTTFPPHDIIKAGLTTQGLEKDKVRGLTTSGARRESPSKVLGILSPGQHQFVIDDEDPDSGIRLRTANGAQIYINDTNNFIYIINKDGSSWVEMDGEGQINMYAKNNINIHSEANVNIHANQDIRMQADNIVGIKALADVHLESVGKMNIQSGDNLMITTDADGNIKCAGGYKETASRIDMNGPPATAATKLSPNSLGENKNVTSSIAVKVPEHEPWKGHINQ